MLNDLELHSFDISTAFLRGLRFADIKRAAKDLGVELEVNRKVWMIPPANVWRHLRNNSYSKIRIGDNDIEKYILLLLKALYGLVDGPLLFQLGLILFMTKEMGLVASIHDTNFLYYTTDWKLQCIVLVYVDDLLVWATAKFTEWINTMLESRFGKLKRSKPPFTFIGVVHDLVTKDHLHLHQRPYLDKLRPIEISKARLRNPTSELTDSELFEFRSLLCSLLWLTLTREDIMADVVMLQQHMQSATINELKSCNRILQKAKQHSQLNGLHFHKITPPFRLIAIGDCGHVTGTSLYAQEGKLVRLMHDPGNIRQLPEWTNTAQISTEWDGHAHSMYGTSRKATRVSHSTSHGEALTQLGTIQIAQLIANRLTEPYHRMIRKQPILRPLDALSMQYKNQVLIPIDSLSDCMDVWELINSKKSLANDKTQRLVILGLREYKTLGIVRAFIHCPTRLMVADGLTKIGQFLQLMRLVTTGKLHFKEMSKSTTTTTTSTSTMRSTSSSSSVQPQFFRIATSCKTQLQDRVVE